MALAATSLAHGTGNPALAKNASTLAPLTSDQRGPGFARIVNGKVDIGAFEIQQASTSLKVSDRTGVYGGTISVSATLTSNGASLSGKTIAFVLEGRSLGTAVTNSSGTATLNSVSLGSLGAGDYANAVNATFKTTGSYLGSNGTGNLDVNQASLTVTANNVTARAGQAFPAFTASYVGFVNGDSPASFKTPLAFSTTAHVGSLPGTYAITPFGASSPNYAIKYVPGTLTITAGSGLTPDPSHPGKFILTIQGGPGARIWSS